MEGKHVRRSNKDSPTQLGCDGGLVLFNGADEPVSFLLPPFLLQCANALEFQRARLDTLFQSLDLVDGEPIMSNVQITHGDVEVSLSLPFWYQFVTEQEEHKTKQTLRDSKVESNIVRVCEPMLELLGL